VSVVRFRPCHHPHRVEAREFSGITGGLSVTAAEVNRLTIGLLDNGSVARGHDARRQARRQPGELENWNSVNLRDCAANRPEAQWASAAALQSGSWRPAPAGRSRAVSLHELDGQFPAAT
jgi:hypothetical protein